MNSPTKHIEDVLATCPACGLLCDDILPKNNHCNKSITFFQQPIGNNRASIMQTNTFNKLQRGRAVHPIHSDETVKNSDIDDRARCGYVCRLHRPIGVELLTQTLRPTHRYHRTCISHHTHERQGLDDARLTFRRANVLPHEQGESRSGYVRLAGRCAFAGRQGGRELPPRLGLENVFAARTP